MFQSDKNLEASYGPLAPYSEHKRSIREAITSLIRLLGAGVIIWVQAPFESIGVKYVVAPDVPGDVTVSQK